MEGLKLTRVIVLDDNEEEGMQIIRALWHNQIPAIYFSGESGPPNGERLVGVRLVFLDMDLIPGTTDQKSKMSTLVGALRRILDPENGPYSVVAWTKHLELVKEFETYIYGVKEIPQPVAIAVVAKDACKDEDGLRYDLQKVKDELDAKLAEISPLLFLQAWEGSCFNASVSVTAKLSKLASKGGDTPDTFRKAWRIQMLRLLNSLAAAEAGRRHLRSGDAAVGSFASALNPLHSDRLESQRDDLCKKVRHCSNEIISEEAFEHIGPTEIGELNSMLHCSYDRPERFYAGNIYLVSTNPNLTPLNVNEFLDGYLDAAPASPERKQGLEFLKTHGVPVLLESNPICDHAQKKVKVARLIAGLLVPRSEIEKETRPRIGDGKIPTWEERMIAMIRTTAEWWHRVAGNELAEARMKEYRFVKKAESLWEFGPLYLDIKDRPIKEYYLLLNASYVYSAKLNDAEKAKALFRLRSQAFSYMHFWFGNHVSRPGMLMVE